MNDSRDGDETNQNEVIVQIDTITNKNKMCYLKLQVPLSNVRIFINKFQQLIIIGGYSKLYNNIAVVTRT